MSGHELLTDENAVEPNPGAIGPKVTNHSDGSVVGRAGLEPTTLCTSSRCPTKLDDRPIFAVSVEFVNFGFAY